MPCLVYSSKTGKRQVFELDPTVVPITVGRNAGSTIRTQNSSVSRNHGRLGMEGEQYFVKDMGSRNGTFLNGVRLRGKLSVSDGDVIHFGEFPVVFLGDESQMDSIPSETLKPGPATRIAAPESVKQAEKRKGSGSAARGEARPAKAKPAARKESPKAAASAGPKPEAVGKTRPSPVDPADAPVVPPDVHTKRYLDQIVGLTRERDELTGELKDLRRQVEQSEKKNDELNDRVQRIELELEAVGDRYQTLRKQTSRQTELVDSLRDDLAQKDESLFDLERNLEEAKRISERLEDGRKGHEDVLAEFKISVTQRDRKIEDMQRQLDLTEYDLRAAKDEIESLQDDFNRDGGDLQKAERRIQHLKEIIGEKESHTESARLELQAKDLEIRQVRMGVGIEDLEEEKRKILEDFYQKSREVEQMTEKNREQEFLLGEVKEQNLDLSGRIKQLQDRKLDIKSHPDYKALLRKYDLRAQQRELVTSELDAAREKLDAFPPEDRARMEDELRFLSRKLDATQEKLRDATASAGPALPSEGSWLQDVRAAFDQWKTNLVLLRTYARDLSEIDTSKLPDLREALDGIEQLVTLLHSDGMGLEEELAKIPEDSTDG